MKTAKRDKKNRGSLEQAVYYNMFLTEAIFEVLAKKRILTGDEVARCVRELKTEFANKRPFVQ